MRVILASIAAVCVLSVTACGQKTAEAPPPPSEQSTESPAPEPTPGSPPAADAPAPGAPDQSAGAEPKDDGVAEKEVTTRSLRVIATPVIVEVDRTQERRPANGGSAVVLFSDAAGAAYRNTVTCVNVWNLMDTATTQEVRVGIRKAADGNVEALRPLYWLNRTGAPNSEMTCDQRLARYDYVRARTIKDKYGLANAGPYFVVARTDEQAAAVIDLTGRSDREIADMVRYFRDGFAFQNDIWDPARDQPEQKRALLASFFGPRFRDSLVASLKLITNPAARAGCRLGDLRDAPCT